MLDVLNFMLILISRFFTSLLNHAARIQLSESLCFLVCSPALLWDGAPLFLSCWLISHAVTPLRRGKAGGMGGLGKRRPGSPVRRGSSELCESWLQPTAWTTSLRLGLSVPLPAPKSATNLKSNSCFTSSGCMWRLVFILHLAVDAVFAAQIQVVKWNG